MTDVYSGHNAKCIDMKRYCREVTDLHRPGAPEKVEEICWCDTDFSLGWKDIVVLTLLWILVLTLLWILVIALSLSPFIWLFWELMLR